MNETGIEANDQLVMIKMMTGHWTTEALAAIVVIHYRWKEKGKGDIKESIARRKKRNTVLHLEENMNQEEAVMIMTTNSIVTIHPRRQILP